MISAILILSAALLQSGGAAESVFRQAASDLSRGDLPAAEKGFLQVLKLQPKSVAALGNLGVTYSRMERYSDAVRVYQQALRLAPDEPGLRLNLGLAYIKQDDYSSAKPQFEAVERSRLASTQSRELLATCELFTGHPARALELITALPRTSEVLFLSGTAHLRLKQQDAARRDFQDLLSTASPEKAHFLLGRAYSDNAQFEEAIAEYKQALALPEAHMELAKALIGLRDNENAERELRQVLQTNPAHVDAAYYLGALLVLLGREDEALPHLERAKTARPEAWGAYYYLGRAYLQKGSAAKALPLLESASTRNPEEAAVWFQLARAYQAAGRKADALAARNRYSALREASQEKSRQVLSPAR